MRHIKLENLEEKTISDKNIDKSVEIKNEKWNEEKKKYKKKKWNTDYRVE